MPIVVFAVIVAVVAFVLYDIEHQQKIWKGSFGGTTPLKNVHSIRFERLRNK